MKSNLGIVNRKGPLARLFLNPARAILLSFFLVIVLGTLLLMLPVSARNGQVTPLVPALFTATSATCVTGLVVVDSAAHWTVFGQVVILLLIQIGGLGTVTFTTFFSVLVGRKMGLRSMQLVQESINLSSFVSIRQVAKTVAAICFSAEFIGALMLARSLVPQLGLSRGVYNAVFLSVSAFCNGGFDVLGTHGEFASLTGYTGDLGLNLTIMALIVVGGQGFLVWHNLIHLKQEGKLTLHTRIVLSMTAALVLLGALLFLVFEWSNPETLQGMPLQQKLIASLFQSVSARTAGFSTIDVQDMRDFTKLIMIVLMFIGAAPGSTGGGIKVTTLAVVVMTVAGVLSGQETPLIRRRRIPAGTVYKALAIISLGLLLVACGSGVLMLLGHFDGQAGLDGIDVVFETVSAFATTGISSGVTGVLGPFGQVLLAVLMFIGRLGPVSFALSIAMKQGGNRKEVLPEAKIMVG